LGNHEEYVPGTRSEANFRRKKYPGERLPGEPYGSRRKTSIFHAARHESKRIEKKKFPRGDENRDCSSGRFFLLKKARRGRPREKKRNP